MGKILITGGCGFIGHHFVEYFLKNTDWDIVVFDKLTYAANGLDRLRDINAFDHKRVSVFTVDIAKPFSHGIMSETRDIEYILHLAAETHVNRSIEFPLPFVQSNIMGTLNMLTYALEDCSRLKLFHYMSTDEVFGPAPEGVAYREWDRYKCGNPYAATKAGGEELVLSFVNTHGLPAFITHGMNVFGERQHVEKYIPLCMYKLLHGEKIFIHANQDKTKAGSRFYIHARNMAAAVHFLMDRFEVGEKYNIVGDKEVDNLSLARMIAEIMDKPLEYELVDYHSSRPGHDLRYALNGDKMNAMGWRIPMDFATTLQNTIKWTMLNQRWLR